MPDKTWRAYTKALNGCCDAATKAARCAQKAAELAERAADYSLIAQSEVKKYLQKEAR
jgi:hypothetical protein